MQLINNSICTPNQEVEIGGKYCYKESLPSVLANVTVLDIDVKDDFVRLEMKVDDSPDKKIINEVFSCGYNPEYPNVYHAGMWRLFRLGEYIW